jgi:hypothetical protein
MLIGLIRALPSVIRASDSRSRLVRGMPGYFFEGSVGGTPSAFAVARILSGPSGMLSDMSTNAVLMDSSIAAVAFTAEP